MEVVIYADVLFALNFFMDLVMVFLTLLAVKLRISMIRLTAATSMLAFYGTLIVFPELHSCFSLLGRVGVSLLALKLLCPKGGNKRWLKAVLVFWLVTACLGGAVSALAMMTDLGRTLRAVMVNGSLYLDVNLGTLLWGIGATYGLIWGFCRLSVRNFSRKRILVPFRLTIEGREISFTALLDTGCELTVPVTGDAMLLLSRQVLEEATPKESFAVPIATAAGENTVKGFYPERLVCLDRRYEIQGIPAIGVTETAVSGDGLYMAVLNPDMLRERKENGGRHHETGESYPYYFFTKVGRATGNPTRKAGPLHRRKRNTAAAPQPGGGSGTAGAVGSGGKPTECPANLD